MSKFKGMLSKIVFVINKYDEVTKKAERKIMTVCGSEKMMDDATEGAIVKASSVVVDSTKRVYHTAIQKSAPARRIVAEKTVAARNKIVEVVSHTKDMTTTRVKSMAPQKKQPAPMCRPISYVQQHDAPTYMPQLNVIPAPMTVAARMDVFVQRGTSNIPMVVCRTNN